VLPPITAHLPLPFSGHLIILLCGSLECRGPVWPWILWDARIGQRAVTECAGQVCCTSANGLGNRGAATQPLAKQDAYAWDARSIWQFSLYPAV
jgi:hypothetical protein